MKLLRKIKGLEKKEEGFTLLELLLVVGVGAILLLAGIGTYQLVTEGNKVNEANRLLNSIKQKTQQAWQGQTAYGVAAAALTPTLVNLGVFPNQYLQGTTAVHPWNDTITVAVGANTSQFVITFTDVPRSSCIAMGGLAMDTDPDFVQLAVGATTYAAGALPSPAVLSGVCTAGATNTMSWTFF